MKPILAALKKRFETGEITQEQYNQLAAVLKDPDPEPALPPDPTELEMLRDYVLDLDFRLIMMEFGLVI